MPALRPKGRLHAEAATFDARLLARETAASDQMLAAWTESYQAVRQSLDQFYAKVAQAQAQGLPTSPAWAYQEHRLKDLLDTTRTQVNIYARDASKAAQGAQAAAIRDAAANAPALVQSALDEVGILATLATADPRALVQAAVGFTGDGTVLAQHLAKTLTTETVDGVRSTILKGLALGKGQDWFVREVTQKYALSHVRAVTIMRTETLRVYRETSRATYEANTDVLEGWTWSAHLDARTCVACALMDGTIHAVTESLDGHPRCRCAMVPRTKSWEDLGVPGLEDTRPEIPSGKAWLEGQTPAVQKALMGPRKFDAWQRGEISLDDMVAQHHDDDFGTMRTERSLKSIQENKNPNPPTTYVADQPTPAPVPAPTPPVKPAGPVAYEPAYVDTLTEQLRNGTLTEDAIRKAMEKAGPLGKANAQEALTRHAVHLADKAAADALAAAEKVVPDLPPDLPAGLLRDKPDNLPTFPQEALDALTPKRGGWTTKTRQQTLDALNKTPEGKRLHKTLLNFQQGGSNAIPRLRTDVAHVINGTGDLAPGRVEAIRELLAAMRQFDAEGRTLYRGMPVNGTLEDVLVSYQAGGPVDLSVSSFSSDRSAAVGFLEKGAGSKGRITQARTSVMVEWEGADFALPIQNLGKSGVFANEKEWIVSGKFRVVSATKAKRGGLDVVLVKIERVPAKVVADAVADVSAMTQEELKRALAQGAMADRRAAQAELVRRKAMDAQVAREKAKAADTLEQIEKVSRMMEDAAKQKVLAQAARDKAAVEAGQAFDNMTDAQVKALVGQPGDVGRAARKELSQRLKDGPRWRTLTGEDATRHAATKIGKAAEDATLVSVRGNHTIISEVPLTPAQADKLLDEAAKVLDASSVLLGDTEILLRVPKLADDRVFRRSSGTLAYVRSGLNTIHIRPTLAAELGSVLKGADRAVEFGHFMPASSTVSHLHYTLAHEMGHIIDFLQRNTLTDFLRNDPEASKVYRKIKKDLSTYGRTNLQEGYAEAFAQWLLTGDDTTGFKEAFQWQHAHDHHH